MSKIFESPDGGKTLYAREIGESDRKLHSEAPEIIRQRQAILELQLWNDIRNKAKTHPGLAAELERVIMIYRLLEDNE
jgi:hypothetical protein